MTCIEFLSFLSSFRGNDFRAFQVDLPRFPSRAQRDLLNFSD
jgi:hypothetical protein